MAVYGMDIEQVRQLANQLGQKAEQIDQIVREVTSTLGGTDWTGPDADQFRNDWQGTLSTQLRNVAQTLRDTQTRASQNAAQQEQASGTSSVVV